MFAAIGVSDDRRPRTQHSDGAPVCHAGNVTTYRVRLEGPPVVTLRAVTALADADGVELVSSEQPHPVDDGTVAFHVTVDGAFDDVADAVGSIRSGLTSGASVEIAGDDA